MRRAWKRACERVPVEARRFVGALWPTARGWRLIAAVLAAAAVMALTGAVLYAQQLLVTAFAYAFVRALSIARLLWFDESHVMRKVLEWFAAAVFAVVIGFAVTNAMQAQQATETASRVEQQRVDGVQRAYVACREVAVSALASRDRASLTRQMAGILARRYDDRELRAIEVALGVTREQQRVPECERRYPTARHFTISAPESFRRERAALIERDGGPPPPPSPAPGVVPSGGSTP